MLNWNTDGHTGLSGPVSLAFDTTVIDGTKDETDRLLPAENGYTARYGAIDLSLRMEDTPEGLFVRDDSLTNTSDHPVTIRRAHARFTFPGGEWDVYTQYSGWINESKGAWQPLTTGIIARNRELRTNENASPLLAIRSRQTGRGYVFHLIANCAWMLSANAVGSMQDTFLVVEMGPDDSAFHYVLAPGETLTLPRILAIPFKDSLEMGSDRLHRYFARVYPRRGMPVICNTWMMEFDHIEPERLKRQVDAAAAIGAEYFVIDAGWFGGNGRWYDNIGDWEENQTGAFAGAMREFSDYVRAKGMKFGLWLEVSRAFSSVPVTQNRGWFLSNGNEYLLDFANEEAVDYITSLVISLIDKYDIAFIKSDFNSSISFDPSGAAFLRWHKGHEKYIAALRAHRPDIYLECCASGGLRMDLYDATLYDSVWISDNHSPYDEARIQKDTLLRLPPCAIEKWPVLQSMDGFVNYGTEDRVEKLIACHDAVWDNVTGLNEDWLRAYTSGGVLGFSFDLLTVSQRVREMMRDIVSEYKARRDFYARATATLLCDTPAITAIRYEDAHQLLVTVFSWRRMQTTFTFYPSETSCLTWENGTVGKGEPVTIECPASCHASSLFFRKVPS